MKKINPHDITTLKNIILIKLNHEYKKKKKIRYYYQ